MTYGDFTSDDVGDRLGLTLGYEALFPDLVPVAPPAWLGAVTGSVLSDLLSTEKSRSEFLVAPVLRAVQMTHGAVAIYSGHILAIDAEAGLTGECDFILGPALAFARLKAPAIGVAEAKRGEIESGVGSASPRCGACKSSTAAPATRGRFGASSPPANNGNSCASTPMPFPSIRWCAT